MEVFVARGYHAAAMDEIAERAGVSKPVLYQHFPGKQELYLALLDESVEPARSRRCPAALRSTTDNRQRVTATFRAYFEYVAEHSGTFRLVFESDFTNDPAVRERLDTADRECADLISQVIKEDAGLADDEAHLLAIGLVGMAQVSARYWLSTLGSIPREAAEQLVARLAWRGISGWPPRRPSALAHRGREPHPLGRDVEVKIGIQSIPRELVVDTDATAEEVERDLAAALAADGRQGHPRAQHPEGRPGAHSGRQDRLRRVRHAIRRAGSVSATSFDSGTSCGTVGKLRGNGGRPRRRTGMS